MHLRCRDTCLASSEPVTKRYKKLKMLKDVRDFKPIDATRGGEGSGGAHCRVQIAFRARC